MRLFLRLEDTGKVITIWVPENTSIAHVKRIVHESGQTSVPLLDMELCRGADVMEDHRCLDEFAHRSNRIQVHASMFAKDRLQVQMRPFSVLSHFPLAGSANVSIQTHIQIHVSSTLAPECHASSISLRDERNHVIPGIVTYDKASFSLTMTPSVVLWSNTSYTVYVQAQAPSHSSSPSSEPMFSSQAFKTFCWSFKTQSLPMLRLFCRCLINTSSDKKKRLRDTNALLSCCRTSPALFDELILAVTSLLRSHAHQMAIENDHFYISPNSLRMSAQRLDGSRLVIHDDRGVAMLNDSDILDVEVDEALMANHPPQDIPEAVPITAAEWSEYNRNNWVNPESGYLAICGKMTQEEENALLIEVVEAFCVDEGDMEERSQNMQSGIPPSLEATVPSVPVISVDEYVPDELRAKLWGNAEPLIFHLCSQPDTGSRTNNMAVLEDTARLIDCLKTNGYAVFELPEDIQRIIGDLHIAAEEYFMLPLEEKESNRDFVHRFIGYVNNPVFKKELFQFRRFSVAASQHLEETLFTRRDGARQNRLQSAADETYRTLFAACKCIVSEILLALGIASESQLEETGAKSGATSASLLSKLFEPDSNDECFGHQLSLSNLSIFQYLAEQGQYLRDLHCPCHSDITLLTLIPLCGNSSGLHLYDWKRERWMDVCSNAPANSCVVFTGELMAKQTANFLLPCMHEVSNVGPGPRLSTPFQLCAAADALIDPLSLQFVRDQQTAEQQAALIFDDVNATDSRLSSLYTSEIAGHFVERVSASRISSNFLRR